MAMAMDEVSRQQLEQEELTLALLHTRAEVARLQEREQLFSTLLAASMQCSGRLIGIPNE